MTHRHELVLSENDFALLSQALDFANRESVSKALELERQNPGFAVQPKDQVTIDTLITKLIRDYHASLTTPSPNASLTTPSPNASLTTPSPNNVRTVQSI